MMRLQGAAPLIGILLCFCGTTATQTNQRYHLINGYLTWVDAQRFCRVKHTDLATVNNMGDKNELVRTLGGHTAYSWIGLQRGGAGRWVWSDGRGGAHFTKWDSGEPNYGANEWCGEISQTGYWNNLNCGENNDFVCYAGEGNYVHYKEEKNWVDSREFCRSHHTDLAYVRNSGENSRIAEMVKSWTGIIGFNNKAWFGLFHDSWRWSDGTQTSFRYWLHSSQGSGNCVSAVASHQGRWVDSNCDYKLRFVCQGAFKVKKRMIRMKVRSGAALTNAKLGEALLIKLGEVLAHESVTDFSISWRRDQNKIVFRRQLQSAGIRDPGCPL